MTRDEHLKEAVDKFNHIGLLYDTTVCRLVGFGDDGEDYYWIVRNFGGELRWGSKVGPFVSLKDIYPRYDALENLCLINGCPPAEKFLEVTE